MAPQQHELFISNQVVNFNRSRVVNFDRSKVVSFNRSRVVSFTGFCIQTALLAHIIFERVSTPNYEFAKGGIGKVRWNIDHHSPAKKIEITVLKDMKQNPTLPEREEYALEDEEYNQYIFNWGAIKAEFKHTFKTSKISGFKKF